MIFNILNFLSKTSTEALEKPEMNDFFSIDKLIYKVGIK